MIERKRHLAKAVTWRLVGSADTFAIGWALTGSVTTGLSISALEIVTKTILYYVHERTWYRSKWGVNLGGKQ